jgi:signal transduction histidine kinase/DNA-binding response OmpR family regulator
MTDPLNPGNGSTPGTKNPIRILILADKLPDVDLMVRELHKTDMAPKIRVVGSRPEYIASLEEFAPDLILADCSLPQFSAAEALQIRNQHTAETPFIIVSETTEEEQAVACMKLGAIDYLLKDRLARLAPAVNLALEKKRLVDDSHRSIQKLQASENKYRSIVDNIGLGVALISPNMKVLETNPQMRRWFPNARPHEQPFCYEVFCDPPGNHLCNDCPTRATLKDGRVHELIHTTRVAGNERKFRIVTSPIRNAQGWVNAAIEIMEDITERQRLEMQLRQAQKMEALGTLAGGIAHDFNNILSAIMGFSELCLDETEPGSTQDENLREVLHASHRARDLVRQILAFSRQGDTDRKPIQSGLVIKEALKLLRSTLPSTIEIQIQVNSHSLILGDPTQIHQIIMNLGANAADAMEANGGTLAVSLTDMRMDDPADWGVHLPPGTYQHLAVADTGDGIPPEELDAIFEPYFSTKPEGKGTGLGLSVVHGIVHSLEGGIRVRSELDKGTVFDIFLPVLERQAPEQRQEDEILTGGREKVLFIDDEPQIAGMAKRHLERLGYDVEIRTDSREALELFKKRYAEFDLVITDVTMPYMSGDRLATELLKIEPRVPIILCTGFSARVSEERIAQLGIKAVAMKPLVRDELARLMREVLDKPGG